MEEDGKKSVNLHLTSVDAIRIAIDLVGKGLLKKDILDFLREKLEVKGQIPTIMHSNQYHHLLKWLKENKKITDKEIKELSEVMQEVAYEE